MLIGKQKSDMLVAQSCLTLRTHGLYPTKLLCPWNPPGRNIGVGFHFLLQGIFLTMGSNLGLLHWRQTLYQMSHQGILGGIENRSKTELEVWLARSLSKMLFEEDGLSTKEWDGKHCLLLFWKKLRCGFLRYPPSGLLTCRCWVFFQFLG